MALADVEADLYRALRVPHELEQPVKVFSRSGEHAACWLVLGAAAAALDSGRRERWLRAAAIVGGSYVANIALKHVIRRKRPQIAGYPALSSTITQLSFPSAHSTTAFAAARAYSAIEPRLTAPLYVAATAMAISRVSLGVHYPTDVVAGAGLGTAIAEATK